MLHKVKPLAGFGFTNNKTGNKKEYMICGDEESNEIILVDTTAKCNGDHLHFGDYNDFHAFVESISDTEKELSSKIEKIWETFNEIGEAATKGLTGVIKAAEDFVKSLNKEDGRNKTN